MMPLINKITLPTIPILSYLLQQYNPTQTNALSTIIYEDTLEVVSFEEATEVLISILI
jgi:hypothetical protein